jgi:hypothetical protein
MFSEYNYDDLPIVKVTFNEGPNSSNEFDDFINKWLELYDKKEFFTFIFDTTNMKNPAYKYALKMSQFIKKLKKKDIQYLEKSIILINSNNIKYLLDGIFLIQKPVAPVYIYNINNGTKSDINDIINDSNTLRVDP